MSGVRHVVLDISMSYVSGDMDRSWIYESRVQGKNVARVNNQHIESI